MTNWKESLKGLSALVVGGTGGIAQTVAPVLAGSYEATPVNVILTAVFIVLTTIGIKEVNKSYAEGELDI